MATNFHQGFRSKVILEVGGGMLLPAARAPKGPGAERKAVWAEEQTQGLENIILRELVGISGGILGSMHLDVCAALSPPSGDLEWELNMFLEDLGAPNGVDT